MQSEHKGLIMVRHPKKDPPKDLLDHLLKEYPSCTGMATASNGVLQAEGYTDAATTEAVQSVIKRFADQPLAMFFGNFPKGYKEDDIPPHIILGDDANPQLVAFAEGDFPNYHKKESGHADSFFACINFLRPKMRKLSMSLGDDIKKVLAEMKDPLFKQEMENIISGTGTITFMASTGEICTFAKQPLQTGFDWGWVSNPHGFRVATTTASGLGAFGNKVKRAFGAPQAEGTVAPITAPVGPQNEPAETPSETKPVQVPDSRPDENDPRTLVVGETNNPVMLIKAPASLDSKNKKRDFYKAWIPFEVQGYKDGPSVQINLKNLKQTVDLGKLPPGIMVKALADGQAKANATSTAIPKTKDQEVTRTNVSATAPQTADEEEDDTGDDLVLNAAEKLSVEAWQQRHEIGKLFKDNNQEIAVDPAEIQKMEKQYPKFTESMNISGGLKAIGHASTSSLEDLCINDPKGAFLLILEQRLKILQLEQERQNKGKQEGAVEQPKVRRSFGSSKAA